MTPFTLTSFLPPQMSHYPNYPLPPASQQPAQAAYGQQPVAQAAYGQQPAQTAYPYTYYASQHPQAPGATPYPSGYPSNYPTGVSGYGAWPGYAYSYPSPHYRTTAGGTAAPVPTPAATPTPARTATFSTNYTPAYMKETAAAAAAASSGAGTSRRKQVTHRGVFTKELKSLMFGFGDDRNPGNDTVNVMEEILIEFITDVCHTAAGPGKKVRLSVEDLRRALSRPADAKKLARMEELLFMQEDIKRARAQLPDLPT